MMKWNLLPCLLHSIFLFWGLWAAADAVSGSPSVFSLSFPGSFEFWRSFEYRGCRASSAWQGESVLYFRQLVPKQAHILYSALPSQFLLECWSCCSRYWVTHWISSQIFKQKGLSLGKQTAHSMVSHHLLGLWATVWSQPQKRWFNRWSFPSCGWDFPQVVHVLCKLMVSWFGMVTWVTFALEELWEDLLSLCLFPKQLLYSELFHAACVYKARRNLGNLKNRSGNFYFLFTDPNICVLWTGQSRTWPGEHKWDVLLPSEQKCQFLLCIHLQNSIMSWMYSSSTQNSHLVMFKTSCSN